MSTTTASKKYTILLTPMNSAGHLNGTIGLGERFVKLGCRVVLVTIGELAGSRKLADDGMETIVIPEQAPTAMPSKDDGSEQWQEEANADEKGKFKANMIKEMVKKFASMAKFDMLVDVLKFIHHVSTENSQKYNDSYETIIAQVKPDLIISDQFFYPPAISRTDGIPWITFNSANPLAIFSMLPGVDIAKPLPFIGVKLLTKEERTQLKTQQPDEWKKMIDEWKSTRESFNEHFPPEASEWNNYLKSYNRPPIDNTRITDTSPYYNIYMYPEVLDYKQDDDLFVLPPNYFNCETTLTSEHLKLDDETKSKWTKMINELKSMPGNEGKPLVYFSLGSLASSEDDLMKRLIAMLANDKRHLYIVSKGRNGHNFKVNEGNMIGENFVPQMFILQNVDAAIIHGGNNSVTECVYMGLPTIVMPIFGDQPDNAQRIEDLKFGFNVNAHKVTEEDLLDKVGKLTEDSALKNKCKQVGEEMRKRNLCDEAVDKIIELLNKKN